MNTRFDHPWAVAISEQMWLFGKAGEMIAKCAGPKLLPVRQALPECCLHPSEQRLNPFEFHGKRCRDAPT